MTNDERVRFTLRIPQNLYGLLSGEATAKGLTINALLVEILWMHVKQADKTEAA